MPRDKFKMAAKAVGTVKAKTTDGVEITLPFIDLFTFSGSRMFSKLLPALESLSDVSDEERQQIAAEVNELTDAVDSYLSSFMNKSEDKLNEFQKTYQPQLTQLAEHLNKLA